MLERVEVLERVACALAARIVAHGLFACDLPQVARRLPLCKPDAFLRRNRRIALRCGRRVIAELAAQACKGFVDLRDSLRVQ